MADLDQLFTTERLNADSAELQRRMTGRVFTDDPIHLEAELPGQKPKPEKPIGPAKEDIPKLEAEGTPQHPRMPTAEQEAIKPASGLTESLYEAEKALGTAGLKVLDDPRNAWMGTGMLAGATVRWMKAGKELATEFHGVQEAVKLKSGEMTPRLEQYSILEDIPGKVKGTTVDQNTLTKLGYERVEQADEASQNYAKWFEQHALKRVQEDAGQAVLDHLEETGRTPHDVVNEFWANTYRTLPPEVQKRFQKYINRETSFKPGDTIATDKEGKGIVGKDWPDLYSVDSGDVPQEVGYLEGTQRGLIALMEVANMRRAASSPKGFKDLLKDERGSAPASLSRPRFQVEGIVERALTPAPLAERVTTAINTKTAILPDEEAARQATALVRSGGVSRDTLNNYIPGTALLNTPHALAAQQVLTADTKEFLKAGYQALDSNDDALVNAALERFNGIIDPLAGYAGAATATGQTLRTATSENLKGLNLMMERAGKTTQGMSPREQLKYILSTPGITPDGLIATLNNSKQPTWRDAWQHLLINSMLSPTSDFINFAATATMLPVHLAARSVGARIGSSAKLLGGKAGIIVGEDEAMIHGLYASFWDSIKLAGRVAKTSKPEIGPAALREQLLSDSPITADAMFSYSPGARKAAGISAAPEYNSASYPTLSRAGLVSSAINFIGVATGLPGRFMLTGDQFIQALAMNAEMHALVYRKASEQAVREGYTASEFYKSYRPIWRSVQANLPPELRKAGEDFSLEVSLNKELGKLGATALNIREQVNKVTGIGGTVALPFFKTLANSAKATWEFSPLSPTSNALGIVAKGLRNDMFGSDPVKRDLAIGKWAVGTMFTSSMVMATLNGRLRGRGPDNKELRQQGWDAKGLPDSFIYNTDTGDSFQINRLGVLANLAGMAADVGEVWLQADDHTRGELAQLLVTAYVGNLTFDYLQTSAGVIQALANGVKGKEDLDLLARSLPGFIPLGGTVRSVEKAITPADDPLLMKDARASLDKIMARFPGYDTLARKYGMDPVPVLRNQFGYATIQPKAAYGTEWFNPMYVSGPSQNETLQKVSQIEIDLGMGIAQPSNIIGKGNVPLSAPEYDEYQRLAGEQWETRATALLPTLQRTDIPDQVKRDLITQHLGIARQTAAMQLKGDNPKLIEDLTSRKIEQYTTPHAPKKAQRSLSIQE